MQYADWALIHNLNLIEKTITWKVHGDKNVFAYISKAKVERR